jgi:bisphosphoglycerate-independent phosphoglycerate mutase (AlkP superfamily)
MPKRILAELGRERRQCLKIAETEKYPRHLFFHGGGNSFKAKSK